MARSWHTGRPIRATATLAVALALTAPVPVMPGVPAAAPPAVDAAAGAETRTMADGTTQVAVDIVVRGQRAAVETTVDAVGGKVIAGDPTPVGRAARATVPDVLEAWVPMSRLATLAEDRSIERIDPIGRPVTNATGPARVTPAQDGGIASGIDVARGATIIGADAWHAAGYTGTGIRIGIIDGGFAGLSDRVASEFRGGVQVRCYSEIGTSSSLLGACGDSDVDHGTAVAETIASVVPDATLFVANPISFLDVLETVTWMTSRGVRIINASFSAADIFEGPGDGTSPYPDSYYRAIDTAVRSGALWINSAGNSGDLGWTGRWSDPDGNRWLDYAPGIDSDSVTMSADARITVALRWSDAWGSSANDYELYLFPSGSSIPVASSTNLQRGSGDPVERLSFRAPLDGTYDIRVFHRAGGTAARLQVLAQVQGVVAPLERPTAGDPIGAASDTLAAPADSANPGMLAVGAVDIQAPDTIEVWSSRGPTLDGRIRPDIVAPDCADTAEIPAFCGTSQAAPYASGAAALLLQAQPTLGPVALADAVRSHTAPLGEASPNATYGWGRVLLGTAPAGPPPPPPTVPSQPPTGVTGMSMPEASYAWRGLATSSSDGTSLVHVLFGDTSGPGADTVLYRRSTDAGSTFGDALALSSASADAAYGSIAASGSLVAATWVEGDLGGSGPVAVVERTSLDGGVTWGTPVTLSPPGLRAGNPALATDGIHVVVAWTNAATGRITAATSSDAGGTFGSPRAVGSTVLAPFTGYSDRDGLPSVAIAGGIVHIAWSSSGSGLAYRRSPDFGATWGVATVLDRLAVGATRSWLAAAGSSVVLAYEGRSFAGGRGLVYLRRSGNAGVTWASRRLVPSITWLPSTAPVALTSGAVIRIAWAGCTSPSCIRAKVWYRQSSNAGLTWSTPAALSGASTYARPAGLAISRRILLLYGLMRSSGDEVGIVDLRVR